MSHNKNFTHKEPEALVYIFLGALSGSGLRYQNYILQNYILFKYTVY